MTCMLKSQPVPLQRPGLQPPLHTDVQDFHKCNPEPSQGCFLKHAHATADTILDSPKCEPNNPFFIEICAGSARVTSCLQHLGLSASFGVDHKIHRNAGRVLVADLTTEDGQALCRLWLKSPNLAGVFVAPPCGTCSRARGIPVKLPNGQTVQGPQPLRSDSQPNGLGKLSWIDRQRVSSANKLYHFVTSIALECIQRGLIVCIENPRSSLYWKTTFFKPLLQHLVFTAHQACAYGSQRPKWIVSS